MATQSELQAFLARALSTPEGDFSESAASLSDHDLGELLLAGFEYDDDEETLTLVNYSEAFALYQSLEAEPVAWNPPSLRVVDEEAPPAIIAAALRWDLELLRLALDLGVSVDLEDALGRTPLQVVCQQYVCQTNCVPLKEENRTACVKLLIERGACVDAGLPNNPGSNFAKSHFTPLMEAADKNNLEVVKMLLSAGGDANAQIMRGSSTHTPLCQAVLAYCVLAFPGRGESLEVKRRCAFLVDAILKGGADPNGPKHDGRNAFEWVIGASTAEMGCDMRPLWPILLRGGAFIPTDSDHYEEWVTVRAHPYLQKIDAAGGWKAYEKAHRTRLLTTFVPKFTHLVPPELVPLILEFSFHIGFY